MKKLTNILINIIASIIAIVFFLYFYGLFGMLWTLRRAAGRKLSSDIVERDWRFYMAMIIFNMIVWVATIYGVMVLI